MREERGFPVDSGTSLSGFKLQPSIKKRDVINKPTEGVMTNGVGDVGWFW